MANSIFSGNSRFSSDFKSVIERSVAIASLPIQQLQSQKAQLESQQQAVQGLSKQFVGLQSAFKRLQSAAQSSLLTVLPTNSQVARTTVESSALPGDYSLSVERLGTPTITTSSAANNPVTDPATASITSATQLQLTVDGVTVNIDTGGGGLTELAKRINTSAAGVQATVVNLGNSATPDYRLSLQTNQLGSHSVQLSAAGNPLLEVVQTGETARYRLNGSASAIESTTRNVTLAPGLRADLIATGDTTLTVTRTTGTMAGALSSFVDAVNTASQALDEQRGENAGVLRGQSLISSLQGALREIAGFQSGQGSIANLSGLGIGYNADGRLTFDQTKFNQVAKDGEALDRFLAGSGGGLLGAIEKTLAGVQDSSRGVLTLTGKALSESIQRQDRQIAESDQRIQLLRESLSAQIAAADASIASLEQQVTFMTGLIQNTFGNRSN